MRVYRILADLLTEFRLIVGPVMAIYAWFYRREALAALAIGQLLSWTSDILDGPLARRASKHPPGILGRNDLAVDFFEASCLLIALAISEWLNPYAALLYGFVALVLLLVTHFARSVAMALQAPIYGWLIYVALGAERLWGWALVGWVTLAVVLTWPRFPRMIIPEFLAGMASVGEQIHEVWDSLPWHFGSNGNHRS